MILMQDSCSVSHEQFLGLVSDTQTQQQIKLRNEHSMRYPPFDVLRVCPSILERFMLALACAFPLPFFSTYSIIFLNPNYKKDSRP